METSNAHIAKQIEALTDREAIRQLPILYCHYVRTRNLDAVVGLYAKDCVFKLYGGNGPVGVHKGAAAIAETFVHAFKNMDPWPFTHNHVVELTGNGRAKGFVYAEIRGGMEGHRVMYLGVYEDEYVKADGTWKFQSRILNLTPIQ